MRNFDVFLLKAKVLWCAILSPSPPSATSAPFRHFYARSNIGCMNTSWHDVTLSMFNKTFYFNVFARAINQVDRHILCKNISILIGKGPMKIRAMRKHFRYSSAISKWLYRDMQPEQMAQSKYICVMVSTFQLDLLDLCVTNTPNWLNYLLKLPYELSVFMCFDGCEMFFSAFPLFDFFAFFFFFAFALALALALANIVLCSCAHGKPALTISNLYWNRLACQINEYLLIYFERICH